MHVQMLVYYFIFYKYNKMLRNRVKCFTAVALKIFQDRNIPQKILS